MSHSEIRIVFCRIETHDKDSSSSSSSSSDSETERDVVDAGDEDCSDGATDEHRLERLHTIIKQNDYRKFRWFTSLFLSDIVDLEELCQVPVNGKEIRFYIKNDLNHA